MKNTTISELNEKYDLDLEKIISKIKSAKAKLVLLQFPDGLKRHATTIVDYLEEKLAPKGVLPKSEVGSRFLIWLDTCFGACDTPILGKELEKKIDLIIQFGHNELMPSY